MHLTIAALFDEGVSTCLKKDEVLFRSGSPVKFMFFVESGGVDLIRHTLSGDQLVLSRMKQGSVLATFKKNLTLNIKLHQIWTENLAHELQAARMNAEIRTLRTVSQKLDVWLETNINLPQKGQLQTLAQTLGVTREALYRELSKRRGKMGVTRIGL
jgi:CRP-like cAMP-binding protein